MGEYKRVRKKTYSTNLPAPLKRDVHARGVFIKAAQKEVSLLLSLLLALSLSPSLYLAIPKPVSRSSTLTLTLTTHRLPSYAAMRTIHPRYTNRRISHPNRRRRRQRQRRSERNSPGYSW